jgi:hypothetical protein
VSIGSFTAASVAPAVLHTNQKRENSVMRRTRRSSFQMHYAADVARLQVCEHAFVSGPLDVPAPS